MKKEDRERRDEGLPTRFRANVPTLPKVVSSISTKLAVGAQVFPSRPLLFPSRVLTVLERIIRELLPHEPLQKHNHNHGKSEAAFVSLPIY